MGAPIRVDTSVPNVNSGFTGTLGAVVTDGTERYILSCNHIMAVNGRVPPGADIVSAATVNKPAKLAKAKEFISLSRDLSNSVDCGVALLPKDAPVEGAKLNSDLPTDPKPRRNVTKIGAVTGETMGRIVDIDADLYVDYSFGTFRFDNQVIIDGRRDDIEFATAGDSGAIVVDIETKQATAMIFAASGRFAIACSLPKVFAELGKQLRRELKLVVGPTRADAKTA
jgi:hypothetical protein